MTHINPKKEDWEAEWDRLTEHREHHYGADKVFIRSLLSRLLAEADIKARREQWELDRHAIIEETKLGGCISHGSSRDTHEDNYAKCEGCNDAKEFEGGKDEALSALDRVKPESRKE